MKNLLKLTVLLVALSTFYNCSKYDNTPAPIVQKEPEVQENSAPVLSAQTFTAAEDLADNLPIGTVTATDADGDALTFSISNNDDALFEISDTGVLSLDDLQSLDFETTQSHTIIVAANDGTTSTEATITINVTDVDDTSFATTWQTTSDNETVTIPTRAEEFTYDYTIDWGDGTTQIGITGDATHSYETEGTYSVRISGTFPAIALNNNSDAQWQLQTVERWGNIQWQTMFEAFGGADNLIINATDAPDLSQVTDMSFMFAHADFSGDLNFWDVGNVTDMTSMFSRSDFNQDIGAWDVGNVTTMERMFAHSQFNQDISSWDVGNVSDMSRMFEISQLNQNIDAWDVGNVTTMEGMFYRSQFNQDINSWDVSSVTNMVDMFNNSLFNADISSWDVSSVTDMQRMFEFSSFNQDINGWDVSNVTKMIDVFRASIFNQDLSSWDVSNVTNMTSMFEDSLFNQDISAWDVSNATNMSVMFFNSPFNQDISTWDVSNVTFCIGFASGSPLLAVNTPNFTNCTL